MLHYDNIPLMLNIKVCGRFGGFGVRVMLHDIASKLALRSSIVD
jgi:hypothetical protein